VKIGIKTILTYTALVVLVVVVVLWWFERGKANKWYSLYQERDKEAVEAKKALDDLEDSATRQIFDLEAEIEKEKAKRVEAEGRIEILEAEKVTLKTRLIQAQKAIKAAPANYIVVEIGKRIGEDEITFTLSGHFRLTRVGANNTLFRFKTGEYFETAFRKQEEISKEQAKVIAGFEKVEFNLRKELRIKDETLNACKEALVKREEAEATLHRAFKAKEWQRRGEGFLAGGLVVAVLGKLLGVF